MVAETKKEHNLSYVIRDGITSQIVVTLTSGAFLIAYALQLGATNLIIGLLASIPAFAQILQLPAIMLIEKFRSRKKIVMLFAGLSRLMLLMLILTPFIANTSTRMAVMLIALTLFSSLGAIGGSAWNSWMKDLIPQKTMGSFFSKRIRISLIYGIIVSLLASYFLDYWKDTLQFSELYSYSILFTVGMLAGFVGLFFVSRIPEPELERRSDTLHLLDMLKRPFRDINFRNLLVFITSWSFAVNLAQPFFIVYMLQLLGYSMHTVILLTLLNQFTVVLFLALWGKYADKYNNKSVLSVSGPLLIFSILGWTFTTLPDPHAFTFALILLLHIMMGVGTAGVLVAAGNISLKLAPKGEASSYLATSSVVNSISAGIAPILGGILADFFSTRKLTWDLVYSTPTSSLTLPTLNLSQWDFFFFFAFILGLYSLHRLSLVQEEGEVDKKVIRDELFGDMRSYALTVASMQGMRKSIATPVELVSNISTMAVKNITKVTSIPTKIIKKIKRE